MILEEWVEYLCGDVLGYNLFNRSKKTYKDFQEAVAQCQHDPSLDVKLLHISAALLTRVADKYDINYKHVGLILECVSQYIGRKDKPIPPFSCLENYLMLLGLQKLYQNRHYELDENIVRFIRLRIKELAFLVQDGLAEENLMKLLVLFTRWSISNSVDEFQSLVQSFFSTLPSLLSKQITNKNIAVILNFFANLDVDHLNPVLKANYEELASAWIEKSRCIASESYRQHNWLSIVRALVIMMELQVVHFDQHVVESIRTQIRTLVSDYYFNIYKLNPEQITCVNQIILLSGLNKQGVGLLESKLIGSPSRVENKIAEQLQQIISDAGFNMFIETGVSAGVSEIDIVIHTEENSFALMVEGPLHFYEAWENQYFQTKKTLLRNLCLGRLGWDVLTINALFDQDHDYADSLKSILSTIYPDYAAYMISEEASASPSGIPEVPDVLSDVEDEYTLLDSSSASSQLELDFLKFQEKKAKPEKEESLEEQWLKMFPETRKVKPGQPNFFSSTGPKKEQVLSATCYKKR